MDITFVSCFYIIKSKFDKNIYIGWMNNFISIVNNFNLIIYSDENSYQYIDTRGNPRIKVIIRPLEEFFNYNYKENWIANHEKNHQLNKQSCWELNMLWSEKIWFVKDAIDKKYYITDFYGWCDIGYFRNREKDVHTSKLMNWPNPNILSKLDANKIYYACVNNDHEYMNYMYNNINCKNNLELPTQPINANQVSIAGGFFICHKNKITWWANTYNSKLELYFKHNYLVKDDQIILVDCILSDINQFIIFNENNRMFDNWFMFQRILA